MPRARHIRFARLRPLLMAPVAALLAVGLARASEPVAVAAWPPSSALLVGEVVTGGASASDEFVEIYNASETGVSLAGLEVVYVTATGGTVTRKGSWGDGASLPPRHHALLANSAGSYASGADLSYSGGLAASGGAIVLRPIGGQPLDAIAWGDAANAYVEGAPAAAPPAGSSVERMPGGSAGNWFDSNDNAVDTLIQPAPVAENLLAPPAPPDAYGSPSPDPTSAASEDPSPAITNTPVTSTPAAGTETPTAVPTPAPTVTPTSTASPTTTPTSTPTPTQTSSPTPGSAAPTQTSTASPTALAATPGTALPIATARLQPVGSVVAIVGTITAEVGRVIDPRTMVVQDETGGISVRLPVGASTTVRRGDRVAVTGALAQPYGNQLVELSRPEDLTVIDEGDVPASLGVNKLDESVEGQIVRVQGTITSVDRRATASVSAFLQGSSATMRIVALRTSAVPLDVLVPGQQVIAIGIVGQRASQSDPGYRVWLRDEADLEPGATPTPAATPDVTPRPTPRPTVSATATASPAASPSPVSIAQARTRSGQTVTVQGVTTVRVGLLDADARRVTIEDATGGILVRLPSMGIRPQPGDRLRIRGKVETYYGAPQIAATTAVVTSHGRAPAPLVLRAGPIPERLEWRLVRVSGTIRTIERDGKAWRVELALVTAAVPVHGDARAAIASTRLQKGARLTVTGIVRRPRANAADQRFALVPRAAADLVITTTAAAGAPSRKSASGNAVGPVGAESGSSTSGSQAARSAVRDVDLGRLRAYEGQLVRIGGLLVAQAGFVLTLRDGTGTANARLPAAASVALSELSIGDALNVTGRVRKSGRERWEVVAETPDDLVRVGSIDAVGNADRQGVSPTPSGSGLTSSFAPPDPGRWPPGTGALGTAGLVPPVLLLLGLASAGLWAIGIYLRKRARPEGD